MTFDVDAKGIVRTAGLHDATLTAFSYEVGVRAGFALRAPSGTETELVFERPVIMKIASLREGSIVDTVFLWRLDAVPPELWRIADDGWNALLEGRVNEEHRPEQVRRLAALHPGSSPAVGSCSCGGAWAALIDRLRLLRR